jgi:hypothetical protein
MERSESNSSCKVFKSLLSEAVSPFSFVDVSYSMCKVTVSSLFLPVYSMRRRSLSFRVLSN